MSSPDAGVRAPRSWAGTSMSERRAERRRLLLAAGLQLAGTEGAAAVTVRSVCRTAQLTDRYFYESFADRGELLLAVFDEVVAEAGDVLVEAVARTAGQDPTSVADRAVGAFLQLITDDPRKGRVLLLEPTTDPALAARGTAMTPLFAKIIDSQIDGDPTDVVLTGTALVGAMTHLFVGWLNGSLDVGRDHLHDYCVRLLLTATTVPMPASAIRPSTR